jgi:chromosome transmission fidelity protein 1
VVIVPYNTLLHKPTRDSLGIKLKNSVVIIDEAHNLLDTISHIHSSEVKGDQLLQVDGIPG